MSDEKYQWTCPKCGKHAIEEVLDNATVTTQVIVGRIGKGLFLDYGNRETSGGTTSRYRYPYCGHVILTHDGMGGDPEQELCALLEKQESDER